MLLVGCPGDVRRTMSILVTYTLRVAVPLLAALLMVAPAATASPPGPAVEFERGVRLFRSGRYAAAREAFERAYRLGPDARLLANTAACLAAEGRPAAALHTYRRFLSQAGSDVPQAVIRRTHRAMAKLSERVGEIAFAGLPPGARVDIDGHPVPDVAGPVAVDVGPHLVRVRIPNGGATTARQVHVRAGKELRFVFVELQRDHGIVLRDAGLRDDPDQVIVRHTPNRPVPLGRGPVLWLGIGLTGALGAGAAVTGVLALDARSELEEPGLSPLRRDELRAETRTLATITDGLIGGATVTGLATLALYFIAGPSHPERAPARPVGFSVSPRLLRGGAVCDLHLEF